MIQRHGGLGRFSAAFLGVVLLAFPLLRPAWGDAPATQPADNALTVGAADSVVDVKPDLIAKWFGQLNDADAKVRDAAFDQLMSLKSADLDTLKDVVKKSLPLAPSQAAVLPGIVRQVYLSGMDYDGDATMGFMGVSLLDRDGQQFVNPQLNNPLPMAAPHVGIMLGHCMPGFGGARLLRDGDVVLSIVERPDVKLDSTAIFAETVRNMGAGQVIHLQILRQARIIRVPVTLDARPSDLQIAGNPEMAIQNLQSHREDAFNDYWSHDFVPLLKSGTL